MLSEKLTGNYRLRNLKKKDQRLYAMSAHLEKERHPTELGIEYEHVNYDLSRVEEDLKKTREEIEKVRTFLDFFIHELSYNFTE